MREALRRMISAVIPRAMRSRVTKTDKDGKLYFVNTDLYTRGIRRMCCRYIYGMKTGLIMHALGVGTLDICPSVICKVFMCLSNGLVLSVHCDIESC